MVRHEHYLALLTEMKPRTKILDAGCGIGAPAREICMFTRAHVTGITLNPYHQAWATDSAQKVGLWHSIRKTQNGDDAVKGKDGEAAVAGSWVVGDVTPKAEGKCEFVDGDFTKMPFEDNTFDAVYATEATCHARPISAAYKEIKRVLKPGGKFGIYEWCLTPKHDDGNAEHRRIRNDIERGGGVTYLNNEKDIEDAFEEVGLEIVHKDSGLAEKSRVPWWHVVSISFSASSVTPSSSSFLTRYSRYPMNGDLKYGTDVTWDDYRKIFTMKNSVVAFTTIVMNLFHRLGFVSEARVEALETCKQCAWGSRDGGKTGTFTPFQMYVARKPVEGKKDI
jgi:sterol 24-C-methyltransferase